MPAIPRFLRRRRAGAPARLGALLLAAAVLGGLPGPARAAPASAPGTGPGADAAPVPAVVTEAVTPSVNVNTATAEQLAAMLRGIGPARARAIVAYREANGAFESLEALVAVRGVSPTIVERNRAVLRLTDE